MKKEDKRTKKTIKAIQNALLHMLSNQPMASVRIIDLCRQADINRTTFYLHYGNTEDVLHSLREEIVERIFEQYQGESFLYTMEHPLDFLMTCTNVIASYEDFEKFVKTSAEASDFLEELKKHFASRVYEEYKNEYPSCNEYAFYIINFITAGTFDTFIVWLRSDKSMSLSALFDRCGKIFLAGHESLAEC